MKKSFSFLLLSVLLISILSCSQNKNAMTSETVKREWMLKTLPGLTSDELVAARASINLADLSKSGAFGGCNRIFFTTKTGKAGAISFTNIGATRMYCEDKMKVEDALVKALPLINKYELTAPHQVAFKDASGKVIATAVAADWD